MSDHDEKLADLERRLEAAKKEKQISDLENEIALLKAQRQKKNSFSQAYKRALQEGQNKKKPSKKTEAAQGWLGCGVVVLVFVGIVVGCQSLLGGDNTEQNTARVKLETIELETVLIDPQTKVSEAQCQLLNKEIQDVESKGSKRLKESENKDSDPAVAANYAKVTPWVDKSNLEVNLLRSLQTALIDSLTEVTGDNENPGRVDRGAYENVFLSECGLEAQFTNAKNLAAKADARAKSIAQVARRAAPRVNSLGDCRVVPRELQDAIVQENRVQMVAQQAAAWKGEEGFFVAVEFNTAQTSGERGVWLVYDPEFRGDIRTGLLFAVNPVAKRYTVYPDSSSTIAGVQTSNPGVQKALNCLG